MSGLEEAVQALNNVVSTSADGQLLHKEKQAVVRRFSALAADNFNTLMGTTEKKSEVIGYGSMSLLGEEDLEALIAMEGMIAHSRNTDIQEYLSFSTRLDTLFYGTRIDESNNPMDPEQIGDAFKSAVRPVGLKATALLIAYRYFNSKVFHQLESVLEKANTILIEGGILPKLDIAARNKKIQKNKRSKPRERTDPVDRAFDISSSTSSRQMGSAQEMFSVMQNLMHGMAAQGNALPLSPAAGVPQQIPVPQGASPAPELASGFSSIPVVGQEMSGATGSPFALQPGMMVGNQKVELVATDQLTTLLSQLQMKINSIPPTPGKGGSSAAIDLNKSLGELLQQEGDENTLRAIDGVSSDVINLITLLYEAIWQDETVQIPIKDLIGRTQITALKIALDDPEFFNDNDHPGRLLINELATAGISWTDFDKLEQDPMYNKMRDTVESLVSNYAGGIDYIISLLANFKAFKRNLQLESQNAEERLKDADERSERLDEINLYAKQKITERILDVETPIFVRTFLDTHFHKFLIKLFLKEGPGGPSWKPVMNTIDVLLWTVQPDKDARDLLRFDKLRPRLIQNLSKALQVTGIDAAEVDAALDELKQIQDECFKNAVAVKKAEAEELANRRDDDAPEDLATAEEVVPTGEALEAEESSGTDEMESTPEQAETAEAEPAASATAQQPKAGADADAAADVDVDEPMDIMALLEAASKRDDLPLDDEHLQQVNKLPIGVWMEFSGDAEQSIRCTFAAKITTIDKYVFVNSDGVKVVEKSRMGLARELKAGSVKIISESPLVDRAMESVIGKLRDAAPTAPEGKADDQEEAGLSLAPQ